MMRTKPARVAPGSSSESGPDRKSSARPVVERAVAKSFRQLPAPRRGPKNQGAKNRQHKHKSEHLRIEGQIEQVKRQAARKNLILPGIGGRREPARPEKAHHRPVVNRARREHDRHDRQPDGNQPGVQTEIALQNSGEVQPSRMSHPQRDESHQRHPPPRAQCCTTACRPRYSPARFLSTSCTR